MVLSRLSTSFFHDCFFDDIPLEQVFAKDFGVFTCIFCWILNLINVTMGKALKVLGTIKCNTKMFSSLRTLYFGI